MIFKSFFDEFPDLVTSEFRNVMIAHDPIIPSGNYAFNEFYCPKLDCDCRKVIIHVMTASPFKTWAIINYGWETEAFYKKWFGKSQQFYEPMSGVHADPFPNDKIAMELTELFKYTVQHDKAYAKRLELHYNQFKEKMRAQKNLLNKFTRKNEGLHKMNEIIGRNDLCYCNSGKKFKKCCLQ